MTTYEDQGTGFDSGASGHELTGRNKPKPKYTCSGCDRTADDLIEDMAMIRAGGFLSCCPERKMIAQ